MNRVFSRIITNTVAAGGNSGETFNIYANGQTGHLKSIRFDLYLRTTTANPLYIPFETSHSIATLLQISANVYNTKLCDLVTTAGVTGSNGQYISFYKPGIMNFEEFTIYNGLYFDFTVNNNDALISVLYVATIIIEMQDL
jgi:hypothetical protein